jgi:hypothetical protein
MIMKYSIRFALLATFVILETVGCGKSDAPANTSNSSVVSGGASQAATTGVADTGATSSTPQTGKTATAPSVPPAAEETPASSPKTAAIAEDTQAVSALQQRIEAPAGAAVAAPVEPATAAQTLQMVDLMQLPTIKVKSALSSEPTYVYYSCDSSLASADAFYKAEFASRGWKEIPSIATQTEQYIDRNFAKDGFVVRFGASIGGSKGEISIMLSHLGNVDVQTLPKMEDAESTPTNVVNAGHLTTKSIPEVVETLEKKMLDLGWQRYTDFYAPSNEVPHYRALTFRKNAVRVTLGVVRNPNNPSEKNTVFYIADHVIPFDIPTPDSRQTLKLDLTGHRAAFETSVDRTQMIALLKKESDRFRWTLKNADAFGAGKEHGLLIATGPDSALMGRLVESNGVMSIWLERTRLNQATTESEPANTSVAESTPATNNTTNSKPEKTEADKTFQAIQSEVDKTINDELKKALGSLQGLGGGGAVDISALQAKADALTKQMKLDDEDDADNKTAASKSQTNPFDVPEDKDPVSAADAKIATSKCTIKHGATTYQLNQMAAYVMMKYGEPVKCILFGEKPLKVDKLKRLLLQGETVNGYDVRGEAFTPTMEVEISGNTVSIGASLGSSSIGTNSSDIQSTVKYRDGKLVGRVFTAKPLELGGDKLEFDIELNQPVLKLDWSTRNDPEIQALAADTAQEYPIPDNCTSNSMEGTKYLKNVEASVAAPRTKVEAFYASEFAKRNWKERPAAAGQKTKKFTDGKQEIELELLEDGQSTTIKMVIRNGVAAQADGMIPAAGKGMLVMGNLSEEAIEVTVAGKTVAVAPGLGASNPKDAPRLTIEPGPCKIQFKSKVTGKSITKDATIPAGTTWGALYDSSFQELMRLF